MEMLEGYLRREMEELDANGIRLQAIGRMQDLPASVQRQLETAIRRTEGNDEMRLIFALSYSGRAELVDAARRVARAVEAGTLDPDAIDEKTLRGFLYAPELSDPDLLIRTGREHRISNYLLWQLAYTELIFSERLWPEFSKADLVDALVTYQLRERRFGRTPEQVRSTR
jgi:undecaprenyl diphosphate synthase